MKKNSSEINRQRIKIGILFNFNPSWMGGIIYILNLIKTLDFLDEDEKPQLILFYNADLKKFVDEIKYPYLEVHEWKFPVVYKGYLKSWIRQKNIFIKDILQNYELQGLYPVQDFPVRHRTKTKLVAWYADLQHKHYPEFFSRRKIIERNSRIRLMLRNTPELVVSSQAVADDFDNFFSLRKNLKMHIFHFVSVIEDISDVDYRVISKKYDLPEKYFIISNQFHKHKNHRILFKALAILNKKGLKINLALTGRFPAQDHSPYINELYNLIEKHHLQEQIRFLGLIPRKEQLCLMKHSLAVIQPSLFEGWSTVIEDARSLQVPVIASDIPVNIEQLGPDGNFFSPDDDAALAQLMQAIAEMKTKGILYEDYKERMTKAARRFLGVFIDD